MTYKEAAKILQMELNKSNTDFYSDRRTALRLAIFLLEIADEEERVEIEFF